MENKNDLGVIQKKGDHLTVCLTFALIVLINCVGFIFPNYHVSYSNWFFDIVNILATGVYGYFAYRLWISTFEDYEAWKISGVVLSTLAVILWILFWGAAVTTKVSNGF